MTTPAQLICDYESLVNDIGRMCFGLTPVSTDVITESLASTAQSADILRAVSKGLQYVYSAYHWSFLRPLVSITTHAMYNTGTITVNSSGVVTGTDTVFPTYSASAGGWLNIPSVGSFAVSVYTSGTSLTLSGFPSSAAFTTSSIYTLSFDSYPLPTGVDSLEGQLTYPQGNTSLAVKLDKVMEVDIRRRLSRNATPGMPRMYAETMNTFDPAEGYSRYVSFYPIPDMSYTLTAIGTIRPYMIDSTNKYPLGIEVLSPCITESCLAAAERDILQIDGADQRAVHSRALPQLLAMAIQEDKEKGSPDTLGVDHGQHLKPAMPYYPLDGGNIYWDAGGGTTGYI